LLGFTTLLTGLAGVWSAQIAKSVFLGATVFTLPTFYFTYCAFRYKSGRHTELAVRSLLSGQVSKFCLTLVGFGLVLVFVKPLNEIAFFTSFCLMIPAHLVVSTLVSNRFIAVGRSRDREP
jgi:ATP synthase protein I